ncbi:MAG: PQQ-binding-like beta-propeller repeat protein [Armatimonadetes bacterium]|nr:PQQ-binding-like beta-propeller repeat protein [Armatimonadota bacterium]
MRIGHTALVAVLLVLGSTRVSCEPMLMARYDPAQSSSTTEKLKLPLALSWQFVGNKFDNNPASPIVVDGTVYFACGDRVYAVELATGALKWKYPSGDMGLGGSVKGAPAYHKGSLFFGATDENLYCLDAKTGSFKWAYRVRGAIRCPPVVVDNMVYVGADDESLYAIEADTGERRWVFTTRDDIAIGVAIGTGMAVISSMDGNMYGLTSSTGKLRWMFRLPVAPTSSSPLITEGMTVMAAGNSMYGLSVRSGQQKWHVSLKAEAAATPAAQGFDVFVPCRDKKIYAYMTGGRQPVPKWTQPADLGAIPMSSPVVAGDTVWVTGSRGVVAAFSTVDGSLKWRYVIAPSPVTTPGALFCDAASSPTIAEGALLVLTDDGVLHCFTSHAPDNTPPALFAGSPANGSFMSGAPPIKISGVLYDIGSGVDFSTATIMLDGQPVEAKVDIPSSTVYYETETGGGGKQATVLADGLHNIVVSAKDYAGNLMTKQWYIVTDSSLPPPRRSAPPEEGGKKEKPPATKPTRPGGTPGTSPGGPPMPPNIPGMDMPPPPPPPPPAPGPPVPQPAPTPGLGGGMHGPTEGAPQPTY